MLKQKRQCLHAGSWYSNNPNQLNSQLTQYLQKVQRKVQNPKIKALIAPHAGYYYSGPTAAWAYRYLADVKGKVKRVFIFGPSHHKYFPGCTLTYNDLFDTPLGPLEVDIQVVDILKKQQGFHMIDIDDEQEQHSIQMHLPYIVKSLGRDIKIVPMMCGPVNQQMATNYAKTFSKYFDDPQNVFIFSSDFCHWGTRFNFTYNNPNDGQIWQSIEKLDGQGMNHIQNHDFKGFEKYINSTKNTICGRHPIFIFLKLVQLSKLKLKTKFVKYAQSQQVKQPGKSSVSYASSITFLQQ